MKVTLTFDEENDKNQKGLIDDILLFKQRT